MLAVALSSRLAGRDNNFQLIRFVAALAVITFHSFALVRDFGNDPLRRITGVTDLGALGVQMFFFVSGFLVTKSWSERHSLRAFTAARVLRIYPALVLATLFGIALAAGSSALPLGEFLSHPQTLSYAIHNATGWSLRDALPGAFPANPFAGAINGSLWTLPIELRLYVGVAILGLVGILTRRVLLAAAIALLVAIVAFDPSWFPLEPNIGIVHYLALLFGLGALAFAWRDAIRLSIPLAVAIIALMLWNPAHWTPGPAYCALLGYVLLVVAYHPALEWRAFNRLGDYSYGLYVYAFPIQQTVIESIGSSSPLAIFATSLPLCLCMAAASWHLVERPCLSMKRAFASRDAAIAGADAAAQGGR